MKDTARAPGTERTSEELAELRAERARFRRERPTLDDLVDAGKVDEPVPHGQFMALRALLHDLKAERERRGLSLTDVSQESGLTRASISRLENGLNLNPTLETLYRYALAIDVHINLSFNLSAVSRKTPRRVPGGGAK